MNIKLNIIIKWNKISRDVIEIKKNIAIKRTQTKLNTKTKWNKIVKDKIKKKLNLKNIKNKINNK